jgi:hypothetical protein
MALSPRHFEFAAELEATHGKDVAARYLEVIDKGPVTLPRGKHAPRVAPKGEAEG